jgi:hypothetical protein
MGVISLGTGQMAFGIGRRELIAGLGSAALAWPLAARAQQAAIPVVGYLSGMSPDASIEALADFRRGLTETGYVEGRNLAIEYRWLDGRYDQIPTMLADLVKRRVAALPDSCTAANHVIGVQDPFIPFGLERQHRGHRECREGSPGSDAGSCPRRAATDGLVRLY